MLQKPNFTQTALIKKFIACTFAGLTTVSFLLMLGNGGNVSWLPPILVFPLCALCLCSALIYPFVWHQLENRQKTNSEKIYAAFYSIIRYTIAFSIAGFGWKKVFGLQFIVPTEIASLPMNRQVGEWLTWYYFGYSAVFGFIIAGIQIGASCLLLFRRTLLFGSIVLFALMLNLMLINICYGMNAGALLQSVVLTAGLSFLILTDYKRLIDFFFKQKMNLPESPFINLKIKNVLKLCVILLSMLFTYYLKYYNN